jgi:hypothetical protein
MISDDTGYELGDPKHPTFHERFSDIWDNREKVGDDDSATDSNEGGENDRPPHKQQ